MSSATMTTKLGRAADAAEGVGAATLPPQAVMEITARPVAHTKPRLPPMTVKYAPKPPLQSLPDVYLPLRTSRPP